MESYTATAARIRATYYVLTEDNTWYRATVNVERGEEADGGTVKFRLRNQLKQRLPRGDFFNIEDLVFSHTYPEINTEGEYVKVFVNKKDRLVFLTKSALYKEFGNLHSEEYRSPDVWLEIIEDVLANSELAVTYPDQVGALTGNPFILADSLITEDGPQDFYRLFYYPNYMTKDPVTDLIRRGRVEFYRG